jgi:hypothetical protein
MDRCGGAAARLPESDRKDLAIQVLAGTETVSDLAAQHGVSRKFVYAQTGKARAALDDAFLAVTPENDALFNLAVTKTVLVQFKLTSRVGSNRPILLRCQHSVPASGRTSIFEA